MRGEGDLKANTVPSMSGDRITKARLAKARTQMLLRKYTYEKTVMLKANIGMKSSFQLRMRKSTSAKELRVYNTYYRSRYAKVRPQKYAGV